MRLLDLYFQAFRAFRKHTQDEINCQRLRKVISHADVQNEILTSVIYECVIEVDWIENIEEGLIFVEKAINENRQFIRTEGEVVPIEKVKHVSKSSVEHLSRHSDFISRAPIGDVTNVIPDKLYVVEKLNDYLVYENRFIYMLLCYLKDFIQMRLDKIKDKTTTYQSHMSMNKDIKANQRHLQYRLNYDDLSKNDPSLMDKYKQIPMVDRLENIYAMVVSFLAVPLMREVSKAPLIKPPVVKTNVLRMNQNFRAALKLYDYVTSYSKDGYTFKEIKNTFQPFPSDMGDEIADTIELTSVITYITSNGIKDELNKKIELLEKELLEAENKKTLEELKRLKKRIIEMNEDPTKYILKLEKRNIQLEKESSELALERENNRILTAKIELLEKEKIELLTTIDGLQADLVLKNNEIYRMNQKYFDDMTQSETIHQQEMSSLVKKHAMIVAELNEKYQTEIFNLKEEFKINYQQQKDKYEAQIHDLIQKYESTIQDLNQKHESTLRDLIQKHESTVQDLVEKQESIRQEMIRKHEVEQQALILKHDNEKQSLIDQHTTQIFQKDEQISRLNTEIENFKSEIQTMTAHYNQLSQKQDQKILDLENQLVRMDDEKKYVSAQFLSLKQQQGLITEADNFTSREKFKQLELEMAAYKKLFKEQWKMTKQSIRESVKMDIGLISKKPEPDSSDVKQE